MVELRSQLSSKVEGQEASKQFKEGGETHEQKSTTTTTVEVVVLKGSWWN